MNEEDSKANMDDTAPERMRVSKKQATVEAQALLRSTLNGVLGTLSRKDGFPFASVAPYALDQTGAPLLFLASIAEHTKNIREDSRTSLLIHAPVPTSEDIQTKARLCLMGEVARVPEEERVDAWARYRARLPAADGYTFTHDFSLWRLEPSRLRWIGGFGEIFWLDIADFSRDKNSDPVWLERQGAVEHMNEDHLDATRDFFEAAGQTPTAEARMLSLDTFGMDFEDPSAGRLRVDFETPTDPSRVRIDVVKALKAARARKSEPA